MAEVAVIRVLDETGVEIVEVEVPDNEVRVIEVGIQGPAGRDGEPGGLADGTIIDGGNF